jgi:hypothetical protein
MPKFRWKRKEAFDKALLDPRRPDVPDGLDILWRERDGLRIVILTNPTPNIAAKLVKTIYRVEKQASAQTAFARGLMTTLPNYTSFARAIGQGSI